MTFGANQDGQEFKDPMDASYVQPLAWLHQGERRMQILLRRDGIEAQSWLARRVGRSSKRVIASDEMWRQPIRWNEEAIQTGERHRVLCASLADVWEQRAELYDPRVRLFETIDRTKNLDYLLLTKRPENWTSFTMTFWDEHGNKWSKCEPTRRDIFRSNVWAGTSVENQETADRRVPHLERIPAVITFLSIEPLLGPIDLAPWVRPFTFGGIVTRNECVDWVIVGGESGHHARQCDLYWIRSLRDQCEAACVPIFIKQLGRRPIESGREIRLEDSKGGNWDEWPEDLKIRQLPKEGAAK